MSNQPQQSRSSTSQSFSNISNNSRLNNIDKNIYPTQNNQINISEGSCQQSRSFDANRINEYTQGNIHQEYDSYSKIQQQNVQYETNKMNQEQQSNNEFIPTNDSNVNQKITAERVFFAKKCFERIEEVEQEEEKSNQDDTQSRNTEEYKNNIENSQVQTQTIQGNHINSEYDYSIEFNFEVQALGIKKGRSSTKGQNQSLK